MGSCRHNSIGHVGGNEDEITTISSYNNDFMLKSSVLNMYVGGGILMDYMMIVQSLTSFLHRPLLCGLLHHTTKDQ